MLDDPGTGPIPDHLQVLGTIVRAKQDGRGKNG